MLSGGFGYGHHCVAFVVPLDQVMENLCAPATLLQIHTLLAVGRKITLPPLTCLPSFVNVYSCPVCLCLQVSFVVRFLNPQLFAVLFEIYVENVVCSEYAAEV